MNSDDTKTALLYRDRTWSEVETPIKIADEVNDWRHNLRQNGWEISSSLGNPNSVSIDLYDRVHDAGSCRYRWLVDYATSNLCKVIVIERWQDLIDFLAHVSSTMLAAVLPHDTADIMEEFFKEMTVSWDKAKS